MYLNWFIGRSNNKDIAFACFSIKKGRVFNRAPLKRTLHQSGVQTVWPAGRPVSDLFTEQAQPTRHPVRKDCVQYGRNIVCILSFF